MYRLIKTLVRSSLLLGILGGQLLWAQTDSDAYRAARGMEDPAQRIEALQQFIAAYPESESSGRAWRDIYYAALSLEKEALALEAALVLQALEAGADEALMLDIHGFVATCNATNFFMVKNGEVWTSTGQYCMNGITRGKVIEACQRHGILCYQKNFSLFDVYGADEAFVTGTFGGLTPVTKVDGRIIGSGSYGEMTRRLQGLYEELVNEAVEAGKR